MYRYIWNNYGCEECIHTCIRWLITREKILSLEELCSLKFLYLSRVMEIAQIEKEEDESVPIHFGGHFLVAR